MISSLNSGELGSHHPPCVDLVAQFQFTPCRAVSELWSRPPWKITWSTRVQCCFCTISFAFSFTDSSFPVLLWEHLFPPTCFSEVVSYICNTVRLFCHILHFIMGFHWPFYTIFKNLHILKFTLCCAFQWVLTSAGICHCGFIENSFITLWICFAAPSHLFNLPPIHWFLNCLYSFSFSRMSYHIIAII